MEFEYFGSINNLDQSYVQYNHLDARNVAVGDEVTMGQSVGTVGTTGNADGMTGEDVHLHIEVGTELRQGGQLISGTSLQSPNVVYDDVNFSSADTSTQQNQTSVIKTVTNDQGQFRIYQQVGTNNEGLLLDEVVISGN